MSHLTPEEKEKRDLYNKTYYKDNRDAILKHLLTQMTCEFCGSVVIRNNIVKHKRSKICHRKRADILELSEFKKQLEQAKAKAQEEANAPNVE